MAAKAKKVESVCVANFSAFIIEKDFWGFVDGGCKDMAQNNTLIIG